MCILLIYQLSGILLYELCTFTDAIGYTFILFYNTTSFREHLDAFGVHLGIQSQLKRKVQPQ